MSSSRNLPKNIAKMVEEHLGAEVSDSDTLAGGCSYPTFSISTGDKKYFLKYTTEDTEVFIKEANGLREINKHVEMTPKVVVATKELLVLEFLEPEATNKDFWTDLAHKLAELHKIKVEGYGFYENNFIGLARQLNQVSQAEISWADFFWKYRINPQLDWVEKRFGYGLPDNVRELLKQSILRELSNHKTYPTVVHGDLWNGNIHCSNGGQAFVIDPAVYYGDREVDIAMTELFGGFSDVFYAAYNEVLPLPDGYEIRKNIYNLYHLLNHFNLFGPTYKHSVETTIRQVIKSQ